jgi:hypothetical protein
VSEGEQGRKQSFARVEPHAYTAPLNNRRPMPVADAKIEPFITMAIEPGKQFTWKSRYEYYTLPAEANE